MKSGRFQYRCVDVFVTHQPLTRPIIIHPYILFILKVYILMLENVNKHQRFEVSWFAFFFSNERLANLQPCTE